VEKCDLQRGGLHEPRKVFENGESGMLLRDNDVVVYEVGAADGGFWANIRALLTDSSTAQIS
jgi:hypothetical protein